MTPKEACNQLSKDFDKYDWFYSCEVEQQWIVVYMNYMTAENLTLVPDFVDGIHIKCAFSAYLLCGEKYGIESSGKTIRMDINNLN